MSKVTVKGMSCQHCVKSVTQALEALDNVADVHVDLDSGVAEYREQTPVSPEDVRKAIEAIGFDVEA